jgi:hypothetical protein
MTVHRPGTEGKSKEKKRKGIRIKNKKIENNKENEERE